MDVKEQLVAGLQDSIRSGDELRKRTLRMALTAIKLAEVDQRGKLEEPAVLGVLQKEVKSRQETIADAERAERPELGRQAQLEIAILEEYLPRPLSESELETLIRRTIAEVAATTPGDMGRVMNALMPQVRGRADGREVSRLVQQMLQALS